MKMALLVTTNTSRGTCSDRRATRRVRRVLEGSGAPAPGHGTAIRVWGSRGKGEAQPLASGTLDDERSGVGQGACLRWLSTGHRMLKQFEEENI